MVLEPKLRLLQSRSRSNNSLPRLQEKSTPQGDQETNSSTASNYIQRRYTFTAKGTCINNPERETIRQRFSTKVSDESDSIRCPPIERKGRRKSSLGHAILIKHNYQQLSSDSKYQHRQCSVKSIAKEEPSRIGQSILPNLNQVQLVQLGDYDRNSNGSYDAEDEYDSHHDDHNSVSDGSLGHPSLTIRNLQMIEKYNKTDDQQQVETGYDSGINENTSPPFVSSQSPLKRRKKKLNHHQPQCDKVTTRILNWLNDCQEKQDQRQLPILFQSQLTNYRC